jgi:hypothetical protein
MAPKRDLHKKFEVNFSYLEISELFPPLTPPIVLKSISKVALSNSSCLLYFGVIGPYCDNQIEAKISNYICEGVNSAISISYH